MLAPGINRAKESSRTSLCGCFTQVDIYCHESCPGGSTEWFHARLASNEVKIADIVKIHDN